jgi:hypothetical protein
MRAADRPAPSPVSRQNALADRVKALDSSGSHYALFWLIFGAGTDLDVVEAALDAADRWRAELAEAAAWIGRAGAAP